MNKTYVAPGGMPFHPSKEAPKWFLDNLRRPGESHHASVNGDEIHFLSWNLDDDSLPALLFVHGFSGHAHWWSFLVPFFTDRYRVVAIDLPGMGDSSHRAEYEEECFGRAILGVIRHCGLQPVTIIGHSFGGIQAMYAMTLDSALFSHGIVVDSNIWFPQERAPGFIAPNTEHKRHPTQADCLARFSLTPPQPEAVEALVQYVGYHSCTSDEQGWYWKFDPYVRTAAEVKDDEFLCRIPVRVDCIYGELSIYSKDDLPQRVAHCFPNLGELVMLPHAYHHSLLDRPLELVAAIDRLLANA